MFNKLRNWKYSFYHWRLRNRIRPGLRNVKHWFKTVWQDRWWDHEFIYIVLKKKLEQVEKGMKSSNAWSVESEKNAKQVRKCIDALDRLIEDTHSEEARKEHREKWGETSFRFEKIEGSNCSRLYIDREKVRTPEDEIQERKDFKKAIELEEELRQKDIGLVFDTMKSEIQKWWD